MASLQITVGSLYMLGSIHYKLKEIRKKEKLRAPVDVIKSLAA